jgi:hypothetical protein
MGRPFQHAASVELAFPASRVHAAIEDLGTWNAWSPFYAMDREADTTVSAPSYGVGARYTWDGRRSGQGALTVLASAASHEVVMSVDFFKPFPMASTARFDLVEVSAGRCRVTWTMSGERPWWLALMAWWTRMDRSMTGHFEEGLRALEAHLFETSDVDGRVG